MKIYNTISWIESLRTLACIMVILLHVSGPWLYKLNGVNAFTWSSVALIHSFTRFCVPVFLMITGTLLLKQNTSVLDFYKIRFSRILKPLLFWSIVYILIYVLFDFILGKSTSVFKVFEFAFDSLIHGAAYHLWYMYLLIALYIFIPFSSKIIQAIHIKYLLLVLITWFAMLSLAQYYESNQYLQAFRFYLGYFGYLVLGYFLNNLKMSKQFGISISIVLLILGLASTFIPAYNNYIHQNINMLNRSFYYLNTNVVVLAIGIFLFFKNIEFKSNLISKISKHSFGIYFIHLIFIMLLNKILAVSELPILLYILIFSGAVLLLSYFSIYYLCKIKFLEKYIE